MALTTPSAPPPASAPTRGRKDAGYTLFAGHLVTIFGLSVSNILLGLCLLWTLAEGRRQWPPRAILRPFGAYVACLLLAILFSDNLLTSVHSLGRLLTLAALPLALCWAHGEGPARRLVDLMIGASVAFAGVGLWQIAFTSYGPLENRSPGPFSHYMTFSGILLLGGCLILARLLSAEGWRRPSLWVALAFVQLALGLTLSRSAWVAAVAVIALATWYRRRRWAVAFLVALALAAVATSNLSPPTWQRAVSIFDLEDPSNHDRLCMLNAGVRMVADHPLLGVGPGMVSVEYPRYRSPTAIRQEVRHLHNTAMHLAAERGLPALLAYLWLMGAAGLQAWRSFRREGAFVGPRADLHLATLLGLLALNLAGLFEANWRDNEIQIWALFLLALPFCLGDELNPGPRGAAAGSRHRPPRPASGLP